MYNLSVATDHTFFVGEGRWLVHNASSNCITVEYTKRTMPHFREPTEQMRGLALEEYGIELEKK